MMTAQVLLEVSLFALLCVDAYGFPAKGSNYKSQSGFGDSGGDLGGSHQGLVTVYAKPGFYSTSRGISQPVMWEKLLGPPQYVQVQPGPLMQSSAIPGPGYAASGGSLEPHEGGSVAESYLPVPGSLMPLPAAYTVAPPQSGNQANFPEMEWVIAPQAFEVPINSQPQGAGITGPSLPPAPPALLSGETSNIVKQAELGRYQQQTEEFGYLANGMSPGPAILPVTMQGFGVSGLLGASPYPRSHSFANPDFNYRVLYGLYLQDPWHSATSRRRVKKTWL